MEFGCPAEEGEDEIEYSVTWLPGPVHLPSVMLQSISLMFPRALAGR